VCETLIYVFGNGERVKLVIFDLDQTLVNVFPVHEKAFHATMLDIFGINASFKNIDHTGKRLEDVITEYARMEGVTPQVIAMNIEEAERAYELNFLSCARNVKRHVLPGAVKLLGALKTRHKLALVTGSSGPVADLILKDAGLRKFFGAVVTSDMAPTRAAMVKLAIKKSGKVSQVWVIGDSVRDIEAGNANRAKTIAVLTGEHTRKMLATKKPTHIFKDLTLTKKILEAIQ